MKKQPNKKHVDTIEMMARSFDITWSREVLAQYLALYDGDCEVPSHPYAACVKAERVICMNRDMIFTPESALEALFHEMGEGILDFLGVQVDHTMFQGLIAMLVNSAIQSGLLDPNEFVIAGLDISKLKRETDLGQSTDGEDGEGGA